MKVKWRKMGDYSGPVITGDRSTPKYKPSEISFWTRTLQLTAAVECYGRFGVVNLADSAVSAGLLHPVALFPRGNEHMQGPLFELLRIMNYVVDVNKTHFGQLLEQHGFIFVRDGTLRWTEVPHSKVSRRSFQAAVVPVNGRVPKIGIHWEQSKEFALTLHRLFSDPATFRAQELQAIDTLKEIASRNIDPKLSMINLILPKGSQHDLEQIGSYLQIGSDIELAHAIYICFSVNAPSWARDAYKEAFLATESPSIVNYLARDSRVFSKALIKALTNQARKWDDDKKNSRYQRSRKVAMKMWPPELFEDGGIMPEDIDE